MVTVESVYENHKKKRVSRLSHEAVQWKMWNRSLKSRQIMLIMWQSAGN